MAQTSGRSMFSLLNKYFMVPVFRLGLGPLIVNPLSGYIMVLKIRGRKTGKLRFSPVNYVILDGSIYCMAGFGHISDWYRNLRANPNIEVILPGRALSGRACEITDQSSVLKISRAILRNAGFAGFFEGFNPWTASDQLILEKLQGCPIIRIQPEGIGSGPFDGGGWIGFWLVQLIIIVALILWTK